MIDTSASIIVRFSHYHRNSFLWIRYPYRSLCVRVIQGVQNALNLNRVANFWNVTHQININKNYLTTSVAVHKTGYFRDIPCGQDNHKQLKTNKLNHGKGEIFF